MAGMLFVLKASFFTGAGTSTLISLCSH